MDLLTLIRQIQDAGYLTRISRNPLAQFGMERRRYIGAELLPERFVLENQYREDQVKFRTIVANDGTRYSPTQKKDGDLTGYVDVILGNSDIAREMTGSEYDALIALLGDGSDMQAIATITRWADTVLQRALAEKSEKERWEAIIDAQVIRQGDNSYSETVNFSNPAGHRFNAAGVWSNDAYDPFEDIFDAAQILYDKGFMVSRIISSRTVTSKMGKNDKVRARVGRSVVSPTGQIQGSSGRADLAEINQSLSADGLPPIELYDLRYRTQTGTFRFLPDNVFCLVATTERDMNIDVGDGRVMPIPDSLGYYAIGRAAGQRDSGRVVNLFPKEDKPPRIEGEGFQTSFPVILEPEAIVVIKNIT
jgi:Phage major capsid protein E